MTHPVRTFEPILVLLRVAVGPHVVAARLRLSPSAALLIGGGLLAFVSA